MSEEISDAPAFCQRLSKEEAQRQANEITQKRLAELNENLEKNLTDIKNKEKLKPLDELDEQVKLSEMLLTFFEMDELNQKAKMLELFKEIIETRKNSQTKDKMIEEKDDKILELNEDIDEANAQLESYQRDNDELEKTLKSKDNEISRLEKDISGLKFQRIILIFFFLLVGYFIH